MGILDEHHPLEAYQCVLLLLLLLLLLLWYPFVITAFTL